MDENVNKGYLSGGMIGYLWLKIKNIFSTKEEVTEKVSNLKELLEAEIKNIEPSEGGGDMFMYQYDSVGSNGGLVGKVDNARNSEKLEGKTLEQITTDFIATGQKGVADGIATLGTDGKIPESQLPSYVDDVVEGYLYNEHFYSDAEHTTYCRGEAESGKIYYDLESGISYRYGGSKYIGIISSGGLIPLTTEQIDELIRIAESGE